MTIINVIGGRSQKYGGLERFNIELGRQLASSGDKLVLLYESVPLSSEYLNDIYSHGIELVVKPARGHFISFSLFLLRYIVKNKPDIIHVHFDPAGYMSLLIAKVLGVKRKFKTVHSMMGIGNFKLSWETAILKRLMFWASDKVFTVSDAIRKEHSSEFKFSKNMETLYLGVDSNKINDNLLKSKYKIPSGKLIITCVAFHGHIKGVDILLKSLSILKEKYGYKDFICLQVGGGNDDYLNYLRRLTHDLNLEDEVIWMGLQNNVSEIYAVSDICIQPSRSEGISLSLMEASMQGVPIIASNVGGIPEVVNDGYNGFLVGVEDHNDIADKIYLIANSPELKSELGLRARDNSLKKFMLSENVHALIKEYKK